MFSDYSHARHGITHPVRREGLGQVLKQELHNSEINKCLNAWNVLVFFLANHISPSCTYFYYHGCSYRGQRNILSTEIYLPTAVLISAPSLPLLISYSYILSGFQCRPVMTLKMQSKRQLEEPSVWREGNERVKGLLEHVGCCKDQLNPLHKTVSC